MWHVVSFDEGQFELGQGSQSRDVGQIEVFGLTIGLIHE